MTTHIKEKVSRITSNPIGAAVGGFGAHWGIKKAGITNVWAVWAVTIVGVIVGAEAQAKISSMHSAPKAADVKGK